MISKTAAYEAKLVDLDLMSGFKEGTGDSSGISGKLNADVNKTLYAFCHTFQIDRIDMTTLDTRLLSQTPVPLTHLY